jgi:hypothetical protein
LPHSISLLQAAEPPLAQQKTRMLFIVGLGLADERDITVK